MNINFKFKKDTKKNSKNKNVYLIKNNSYLENENLKTLVYNYQNKFNNNDNFDNVDIDVNLDNYKYDYHNDNYIKYHPNLVEPNLVEPNIVEPNLVEPNVDEPNIVEPNVDEPNVVEPNLVEPNLVEPNIEIKNNIFDNKLKTIVHISHNYGGGTNQYINNIIKIYHEYTHIIVNLLDDKYCIINDNYYLINENINIFFENSIIFVHSLLYNNSDNEHKINFKILNLLKNNFSKKIMILHDYFLLFPTNPNPIKNLNLVPKIENIKNAENILKIFDNLYFNSSNCYINFSKYFNIKNATILNSVPDISFYPRKFNNIISKKTYNICIMGDIGCDHKGFPLVNKIIKSLEDDSNFNFIIIGNFHNTFKNLKVHGKYDNDDIFDLINMYDIDIFMFTSLFEETYSYTLSIAIHTGFPIIYNNIGSYPERLENYDFSFLFNETNYHNEIPIILKNITQGIDTTIKNKKMIYKPVIYKNLPEFNDLIKIKNYKFYFESIKDNLTNKIVCFIHITNLNNEFTGYNIFLNQIHYIKTSGLYDKLDYIFVTMLGKHIKIINDHKIKLVHYSENCNEWEFPSIKIIKYFSDNIKENIKILRIHTKGVLKKENSYEWRKYLEYFLIGNSEICIKLLNNYKCVGVNQQYYNDDENKYRNHFSGNFWWTNSYFIKTLPLLNDCDDRYITEHWLIGDLIKNDYRYFLSLHHIDFDLYNNKIYENTYNLEKIKNNVKGNLLEDVNNKKQIYGLYFICCIGNYLEIVKSQINKLLSSKLYYSSEKIICFVCNVTDECLNLLSNYEKFLVVSTKENLFEKFAINNFKKYIDSEDYYLYYMHSKGVTKKQEYFEDWRNLCDHFTIEKWRISFELLNYYDCVGTNLKNFPKKHFSGNFWWTKSEHLNKLKDINNGYLSCEMYICSYLKTNYVSIYQSYVNHGDTLYPEKLYNEFSDNELIDNICIVPDFNEGDINCIYMC